MVNVLSIIAFLIVITFSSNACAEENMEGGFDNVPNLKLKGFADVGYVVTDASGESNNSFVLGSVDLMIISKITEKVSFFMESLIEIENDETGFDPERIVLKYSYAEYLNIKAGRIHSPIGYYNLAYHHGHWLETVVLRPEIYKYEDEHGGNGGFLPDHLVGLDLSGKVELSAIGLEYNIGVSNGRYSDRYHVTNISDQNNSKAFNAMIAASPDFIKGFKLGASIYLDTIPKSLTRKFELSEIIVGGQAVYDNNNLLVLFEIFDVMHNLWNSIGLYSQVSYKIGDFTPYYRFDMIDYANNDPYYVPVDIDINKHSLGIRWDMFSWNALKLEYSLTDRDSFSTENSLIINWSLMF